VWERYVCEGGQVSRIFKGIFEKIPLVPFGGFEMDCWRWNARILKIPLVPFGISTLLSGVANLSHARHVKGIF